MSHRNRRGRPKLEPLVSGRRPFVTIGFEEGEESVVHTNIEGSAALYALLGSLDVHEDWAPFVAAIREVVDRNRDEIDGA